MCLRTAHVPYLARRIRGPLRVRESSRPAGSASRRSTAAACHRKLDRQALATARRSAPAVGARRMIGAEVFHPSHRQSAFASALVGLLRDRGFSARPVPLGGTRSEMLHTVRKTQPDTALVVIEFAAGDYKVVDLMLAVARWKLQGRRVVLCRANGAPLSSRRLLALRLLRFMVDRDLVAR